MLTFNISDFLEIKNKNQTRTTHQEAIADAITVPYDDRKEPMILSLALPFINTTVPV